MIDKIIPAIVMTVTIIVTSYTLWQAFTGSFNLNNCNIF